MRCCHLLGVVLLLASCGSSDPGDRALPTSVSRPVYGLGDSYQFSDGRRESVVAVEGDIVRWRSNDGTYITSRDILLPRLAWSDAAGQGQRNISLGPVAMFPLQVGKAIKFTATRSFQPVAGQWTTVAREDWLCEVPGKGQVTTPAGSFDTWRVTCRMRETPAVTGNGLIRQSVDYAPEIGFYVRVEDKVGDAPSRVAELSRYTNSDPVLADSALHQRSSELQQALEHTPSGTPRAWNDAATGADGDVVVLNTRHSDKFGWCRDFAERIRAAGRSYTVRGTGCRNTANAWDVVALAPNVTVPR